MKTGILIEFNKIIIYMEKETDKNIKYHFENQGQYCGVRELSHKKLKQTIFLWELLY